MKHFPSLLHSTMPEEVAVTRPKRFFTKNTGLRKVLRPCMGADACLDLFSKFFIDLQSKIRNCNKSIYDRIHRPLNEYCEDGIPTNTSLPTQWWVPNFSLFCFLEVLRWFLRLLTFVWFITLWEGNLNKSFGCCKKLCVSGKIFLLACVFEYVCYNNTLKL